MDWMKIGWALALLLFIIVLFPNARRMLKESPKGSQREWLSALIPLILVILFVLLLIKLV